MPGYLRRLLTTGAAYQAGEAISKLIALALLPIYTRHLTTEDYGTAELLLTLVILLSIVIRLGIHEAFVRFHFLDEDEHRRRRIARASTGFLLAGTTLTAIAALVFAAPLSELVLGREDVSVMRIAVLGLWAFTNLELAYALLRVEEKARTYLIASLTNVALTIVLTLWLVIGEDAGADGLLGGNFAASAIVLIGVWWSQRDRFGLRLDRAAASELLPMLRFGLPIVPAEVSVFLLNVVDRVYLYRVESGSAAGLYSLAVKLSAAVVIAVRAFQLAWPPLAYSIQDDREASRVYGFVTTYYVLATGLVVAGLTLLGRWVVRIFAAPDFAGAYEALPWVALGWALYGLFLVFVVMAGRAQVTTRNFPAALAGLAVNVALLLVLVPPLGIAGAGIALCGAYLVMLALMYVLTRRLFAVAFEWGRLARLVLVLGGLTVAGELLLPADGAVGLATRALLLAALLPLLAAVRFFLPWELDQLRRLLLARWRSPAAPGAPTPAAQEPARPEAPLSDAGPPEPAAPTRDQA